MSEEEESEEAYEDEYEADSTEDPADDSEDEYEDSDEEYIPAEDTYEEPKPYVVYINEDSADGDAEEDPEEEYEDECEEEYEEEYERNLEYIKSLPEYQAQKKGSSKKSNTSHTVVGTDEKGRKRVSKN